MVKTFLKYKSLTLNSIFLLSLFFYIFLSIYFFSNTLYQGQKPLLFNAFCLFLLFFILRSSCFRIFEFPSADKIILSLFYSFIFLFSSSILLFYSAALFLFQASQYELLFTLNSSNILYIGMWVIFAVYYSFKLDFAFLKLMTKISQYLLPFGLFAILAVVQIINTRPQATFMPPTHPGKFSEDYLFLCSELLLILIGLFILFALLSEIKLHRFFSLFLFASFLIYALYSKSGKSFIFRLRYDFIFFGPILFISTLNTFLIAKRILASFQKKDIVST